MELTLATAVPVIIAATAAVSGMGFPNRYLPLVNIAFGLLATFALHMAVIPAITTGIILGLSAAGLYRSAKVTILGQ